MQENVIAELWAINEAAADYWFNRSHAACYGLVAYRTAWLRANYPAEYMAALISSVMSTKDKVPFFVAQCEDMGIEVCRRREALGHDFKVVEGNIRFGLDAVKGLGFQAVEAIIGAREEGGPFTLDRDFCRRVDCQRSTSGRGVARQVRRDGLAARHAHGHDADPSERPGPGCRDAAGRPARTGLLLRPRRRAGSRGRAGLPVPELPDEREQPNEWEKETLGPFLSSTR